MYLTCTFDDIFTMASILSVDYITLASVMSLMPFLNVKMHLLALLSLVLLKAQLTVSLRT